MQGENVKDFCFSHLMTPEVKLNKISFVLPSLNPAATLAGLRCFVQCPSMRLTGEFFNSHPAGVAPRF
jgi:hypothetical protein